MRTFPALVDDLYRTLKELDYLEHLPADKLNENELAELECLRSHYDALIDELNKTEWPLTSTRSIDLPDPYATDFFELSIFRPSGQTEEEGYVYMLSYEFDPWIFATAGGFPSRAAALAGYLRGRLSIEADLPDHLLDPVIEGPIQVSPDTELRTVYTTDAPGHHVLEILQCGTKPEELRYTWQIRNARAEVVWSSTESYHSRASAYQAARWEIARLDLDTPPSACSAPGDVDATD